MPMVRREVREASCDGPDAEVLLLGPPPGSIPGAASGAHILPELRFQFPERTVMSDEPMTALREAAAQLHELFTEYLASGFTEHQALYLVGCIIRPQQPPQA